MLNNNEHQQISIYRRILSLSSILLPYRHILLFALFFILVYAVTRITGIILYHDVIDLRETPKLLFNGLRTDISGLGYILALPVLLTFIWSSLPEKISRIFFLIEKVYLLVVGSLVFFMELCTFPFMEEYATRPNRLFVEYIIYPTELTKLMINGHLFSVITVLSLMAVFIFFFYKVLNKLSIRKNSFNPVSILIFILIGALTFISARSSFDHRPFNIAKASFSTNQIVNTLTANSGYTLVTSIKGMMSENNYTYETMPDEDILNTVKTDTGFDYSPATENNPTMNHLSPTGINGRKNIVIILEESMGAQYVGFLGGSNLTPNLDRIYHEGLGFSRLYATGVRSVRGIEAVTAGFTPTINTSTVKREKTQKNFFNLASVLKDNGYHNSFIYGGESHFDNMKSFFLGNGYTEIIDFNSYTNPIFISSWGVSDEDLFNKALEHFDNMHQKQQLFYSLVFTSSNHDPFEIIESFAGNVKNRDTAVRYADYALGKFYDELKKKPYFNDTVFLVIADHDSRAWGNELIPVKHFHIPGVIFGGGITPKIEEHVVSQIDMPKTLLSLAGITADVPTVGYDLTNLPENFNGRALLQFYQNFCYLKDDGSAVMILPDKKISTATYDFSTKKLTESQENKPLEKVALAYALLGELAYDKGFFSVKKDKKL